MANRAVPDEVINANGFREYDWVTTHLRTFYAGLFKRIKKEDLFFEGRFYPVSGDMAMMFPMLEMAGLHAKHLDHLAYVYNIDNPLNDFKKDIALILRITAFIRTNEKYEPVTSLGF